MVYTVYMIYHTQSSQKHIYIVKMNVQNIFIEMMEGQSELRLVNNIIILLILTLF